MVNDRRNGARSARAHVSSAPIGQSSPLDDLYWQDEILQVMFWLLGEGFADEVTVADLRRFLDTEPGVIAGNLESLACMNLVRSSEPRRGPDAVAEPGARDIYRLTESGKVEAQRRFVDEFRPFLGRSGHGECSDACWCHDPDHAGEECPSTVHAHR